MEVRICVAIAFLIPSILGFASGHPDVGLLMLGPAVISLLMCSGPILEALSRRAEKRDRDKARQQRLQNNRSDQS